MKLRNREGIIDHKFERLSAEISSEEFAAAEYNLVSLQLSQEDQEEAVEHFDKLIQDNFLEDKSEDWSSNESFHIGDIEPAVSNCSPGYPGAMVDTYNSDQGESMHCTFSKFTFNIECTVRMYFEDLRVDYIDIRHRRTLGVDRQ